jgi:hypothetical protein
MHTYQLPTQHQEMATSRIDAKAATDTRRVAAPASCPVNPGRPMSFKDALNASMAKFDPALHRLAK